LKCLEREEGFKKGRERNRQNVFFVKKKFCRITKNQPFWRALSLNEAKFSPVLGLEFAPNTNGN